VSALGFAGDEPVALVLRNGALVAHAVESGRERVLWSGTLARVVLDATLDLIWVQSSAALEVVDLRAPGDAVIPIAQGLVSERPVEITVMRTTDGGKHLSLPSTHCDTSRLLSIQWADPPRFDYVGEPWGEAPPAVLTGAPWLLAQLGRGPGSNGVSHRDFPYGKPAPGSPFAGLASKCGWDGCGMMVPFDGSGVMLVVTTSERGDCQLLRCHLYDPVKKAFGTPPRASTWGALATTPAGSCGPYHFDRAGKRLLHGTSFCTVGSGCEDLGGDAEGWLSGGVDVGAGG
jgi:hypothetical protein